MQLIARVTGLFPLWAVLFSALALYQPALFVDGKAAIVPLLSLVMFLMGLTLTASDFKRVLLTPKSVGIGVLLQFAVMPLAAFLIGIVLALPGELAAGLILVGSCGGGTASNVICYLARANVALSITMTIASTLLGVVMTPLLCWLYIATDIDVDHLSMLVSIIKMVIAPVLLGVALNHFFRRSIQRIEPLLAPLSVLAIVVIIAVIVALNEGRLVQVGVLVFVAVVLHNSLGLAAGYYCSRFSGLAEKDCRAIAIEVGMQNSGLAVALALKYFSPAAALPGALFSVWHNIAGSALASYWKARKAAADSAELNPH